MADRSALAGSVATMDRLIRTLVQKAEIPLEDAVRMASETPSRIMVCLLYTSWSGTYSCNFRGRIVLWSSDVCSSDLETMVKLKAGTLSKEDLVESIMVSSFNSPFREDVYKRQSYYLAPDI